jgi:uncharacterized LabA/DUF88 family protein
MTNRVAVFIDYQNVYGGARRAFFDQHDHYRHGQVSPIRLGLVLTAKGLTVDPTRSLEHVFVFRGEPSAEHQRSAQAAFQRQLHYWNGHAARLTPVTRPVKYYEIARRGGAVEYEGREKGIDVLIALHMVMGAMRDEFDTAVLFSADTDLVPALEATAALGKRCEVASWRAPQRFMSRLRFDDRNGPWCHWLTHEDYERVHDPTDYKAPVSHPPAP